jgi:hypothetical protein
VIRRVLALLGGGAALLSFASCSTFDTDDAATVNGTSIPAEQLSKMGEQLSSVEGLREDFVDSFGSPSGDLQRNLLGLLIDNQVASAFLESRGRPLTQADRDAGREELSAQGNDALIEAGDEIADALTTSAAIATAIPEIAAPTPEQIAAAYADRPASLGVVCANQIVVDAEGPARDAAELLAAGETADAVAETVGATAAGTELIGTSGAPCPDLADLANSLPPDVYRSVLDAKPGVPLGPFSFPNGDGTDTWVVLQVQELADAEADLTAAIATNPGNLSYLGAAATADVWVSSEYGAWDAPTRSVVALTPAAEPAAPGAAGA